MRSDRTSLLTPLKHPEPLLSPSVLDAVSHLASFSSGHVFARRYYLLYFTGEELELRWLRNLLHTPLASGRAGVNPGPQCPSSSARALTSPCAPTQARFAAISRTFCAVSFLSLSIYCSPSQCIQKGMSTYIWQKRGGCGREGTDGRQEGGSAGVTEAVFWRGFLSRVGMCPRALPFLKVEFWLSTWDPETEACGFSISD